MSLTFGGISALASRDIGINPAKFNESFIKRVNSIKNPLECFRIYMKMEYSNH
jgi:hypothetical protein